jgi:hypothetical protein
MVTDADLLRENAALKQRLSAVEAACLEVCHDSTPEGVSDEDETSVQRFLLLDEHGGAIINTDDPAEVIRRMAALWEELAWKVADAEDGENPTHEA